MNGGVSVAIDHLAPARRAFILPAMNTDKIENRQPVLLVLHRDASCPGQVEAVLKSKSWPMIRCCLDTGDTLPKNMEGYSAAVIFGGPMSANDDHLPAIKAELDWLPEVLNSGKPFFGICLGAQMLARCLGGTVSLHPTGEMEIGYYPITPAPAANGIFKKPMHVYHWHKEGFTLPVGAEILASGDIYPNQAFRYGKSAYGVQFHPEIQAPIMNGWLEKASHMLAEPGAKQHDQHIDGHTQYGPTLHQWLDDFIDVWLADA